jgi:WD40-like Beta Propeller Repeat
MRLKTAVTVMASVAAATWFALGAQAAPVFSPWAQAQKIDDVGGNSTELNTTALDGCPIQSPDGLSLYMASNRPGGKGGLDIWVAHRPNRNAPWDAPENVGEPVNSAADDFCPTPIRNGGLFFVSREALPGSCGLGDIYFTRYSRSSGWSEPQRLACAPDGPNSPLDEQGPSYVASSKDRGSLYFSRSSATVPGDIFVSSGVAGGTFGGAVPVTELNDAAANDIQPNVRKDGREVVFSSNRAGTLGAQDIWVATRKNANQPWGEITNLGGAVNTPAAESRPSLSRDGQQLVFGRAPGPEGMSDVYVTTRTKVKKRG